jgi:hypothetical protein
MTIIYPKPEKCDLKHANRRISIIVPSYDKSLYYVTAGASGAIIEVGRDTNRGNYCVLAHNQCLITYTHLYKVMVLPRQPVKTGQFLGIVGYWDGRRCLEVEFSEKG